MLRGKGDKAKSQERKATPVDVPSQEDRRRFLGCLATVLATSYEYDKEEGSIFWDDEQNNVVVEETKPETQQQSPGIQLPWAAKADKIRLARSRHRKRRYEVLSDFLIRSGRYLQLDETAAGAYIPLLSSLPSSPTAQEPTVTASESENILDKLSRTQIDDFTGTGREILEREIDSIEHFRPFVEALTKGSGFRCLTMVIIQHLLQSAEGYDARVRHAMKRLGVLIFARDLELERYEGTVDLITVATRRFETLEHIVAKKIVVLSREVQKANEAGGSGGSGSGTGKSKLVRGLKVGAAGVAAAGLFAVTGGLAAPGIAAGVAVLAGGTAVTAAAATFLTSTIALTTIFGVGGGTLVAYKMNRRTKGLTEFEFQKETGEMPDKKITQDADDAQLFSTIAISGWLKDLCDFQRPWGVNPSNPPITDRVELLERFYYHHQPVKVSQAKEIINIYKGREDELWNSLEAKYGVDPDHLFPLTRGDQIGDLPTNLQTTVEQLFVDLGFQKTTRTSEIKDSKTSGNRMRGAWRKKKNSPGQDTIPKEEQSILKTESPTDTLRNQTEENPSDGSELPKHIATVWDYTKIYNGELYTLRWESRLLKELCGSVADLAADLVTGGTKQVLRATVLSAVMTAAAWPIALVGAANMIDGTWTIGVERADEAGRELARSLLFSKAGNRPVTLIGYSFGARVIYSCLKELVEYQEKWESLREEEKMKPEGGKAKKQDDRRVQKSSSFDSVESVEDMREPASIVEDVVLMGMPERLSIGTWQECRQVVAGRIVNCFSQRDLILQLMFQLKQFGVRPVCGTSPIAGVDGLENIDVTDIISGHAQYCTMTGKILSRVRHGQPFRSRATKKFEPLATEELKETKT